MLVPKQDRVAIFSYLFREGVICAKKDPRPAKLLGQDPEGNTIVTRNLYVMKLMNSLKSRGYVRETFSWQWYYFFLTDEGIEYLRNYLHVPADVVPATLKPRANVMRPGSERPEKRAGPGGNFQSDSRREGRGFRREYRE